MTTPGAHATDLRGIRLEETSPDSSSSVIHQELIGGRPGFRCCHVYKRICFTHCRYPAEARKTSAG
jgi:hypothetical protein